nr:env polyprotein - simian immunodeficiency virus [Simian immunodeficiency virus]
MFSLLVGIIGKQYVTVFYGVPVWKEAKTHLICATDNSSLWVTTNCIPSLPDYDEVEIPDIKENFTGLIRENQIVYQAWHAMGSMLDTILKPCVKINPYCVKMQCQETENVSATTAKPITTPTTTSTVASSTEIYLDVDKNNTEEKVERNHVCRYNITGLCRDSKEEIVTNFRGDDVKCENNTCYMNHCNESVNTEDCQKGLLIRCILGCVPPGYVMLRYNEKLNNNKLCSNISAVQCTQHLVATVSSFFGFNGTMHKEGELIPIDDKYRGPEEFHQRKFVYKVPGKYGLKIECHRKGNRSVVSTPSATGLLFYHGLEPGKNLKKGMCTFKGRWGLALWSLAKELNKLNDSIKVNQTCKNFTSTGEENKQNTDKQKEFAKCIKTLKIDNYTTSGDRAAEMMMMTCQGEMFFCNVTRIMRAWNDPNEKKWYPYASCQIRQIVDDWMQVGRKIYLPPTSGFNNHIRCTHRVTEMYFEMQKIDSNETKMQIKFLPPSETSNQFVAYGAHYKLVKIMPIGIAPTDVKRHTLPEHHKEKRGAVILGILGLLSLAGSAMGSVSVALTVQSQSLVTGIVEQQKQLLKLIEQQSELLKLTIWGVKNLQTRLTSLENYIKDQALLSQWGCSWAQVCHTSVEWTNTSITPNWTSETWKEWETRTDYLQQNITEMLKQAYDREQRNTYELQKLGDLTSWASWFDFTWWVQYLKWGVFLVLGIIGLRILLALWNTISRFRQGYRPVFSQDCQQNLYRKRPDNGEEESNSLELGEHNSENLKEESLNRSLIEDLTSFARE